MAEPSRRQPRLTKESQYEIVLVDPRKSMDFALELTFVMAAKTLLSANFSKVLLPLRCDSIFEDYMRLASTVLDMPELSFQKSSRSLRQFAKAMQNNGFLVLNTGAEADLLGEIPGMIVTRLCHSNIDDMYPDDIVFGLCEDDEELSNAAPADFDDAGDAADALEEVVCDVPRQFAQRSVVNRRKQQQIQLMLSLQCVYNAEKNRLEQLQQKFEKVTQKAIEKEWRKLNIRSNANCMRGKPTGKDKVGKYQTLTHADVDTIRFYARHSSKKGGQAVVKRLNSLEDRMRQITKHLEDKACGQLLKIIDAEVTRTPSTTQHNGSCQSQNDQPPSLGHTTHNLVHSVEAVKLGFTTLGDEFEHSSDLRGCNRPNCRKATASATTASGAVAAAGANLKLSGKHREFLKLLGFSECDCVTKLPLFADVRRSYKKAALELHPDKRRTVEMTGQGRGIDCKSPAISFQEFQDLYKEFLTLFYDADNEDFNATVKLHLPKASAKVTKPRKRT